MNKSFGLDFVIVNDVIQPLDPAVFQGGPWEHLATVKRGLREYMAFRKVHTAHDPQRDLQQWDVWIEIVDPHELKLHKIQDDNEWYDVAKFLQDAKLLEVGTRREMHIARPSL